MSSNQIDLNALLPYLISGGGGALAGALATGRRKERSGESRLGYLGRILKNSLLAGGVAGGSHYLLNKGVENLTSSGESAAYDLQKKLGLDPEASAAKSWTKEFLEGKSGVMLGAGLYGASNFLPQRFIGSGSADRAAARNSIATKLGIKAEDLDRRGVKTIQSAIDAYNDTQPSGNNLKAITTEDGRRAGLGSAKMSEFHKRMFEKYAPDWLKKRNYPKLVGRISRASRSPYVSNVLGLGTTRPQQVVRSLLALTAMAAPSMIAKNME